MFTTTPENLDRNKICELFTDFMYFFVQLILFLFPSPSRKLSEKSAILKISFVWPEMVNFIMEKENKFLTKVSLLFTGDVFRVPGTLSSSHGQSLTSAHTQSGPLPVSDAFQSRYPNLTAAVTQEKAGSAARSRSDQAHIEAPSPHRKSRWAV